MPYRVKQVYAPEINGDIMMPLKNTRYYPQVREFFMWSGYSGPDNYQYEIDDHLVCKHFKRDEWSCDRELFFYSFNDAIKFLKLMELGTNTVKQVSETVTYIEVTF